MDQFRVLAQKQGGTDESVLHGTLHILQQLIHRRAGGAGGRIDLVLVVLLTTGVAALAALIGAGAL